MVAGATNDAPAAAEAEELEVVERERARRRMSEAAKAQKQGVEIFPHPDAGKTRDKVAAAVGLGSGRTYDRAVKVSGAGHLPLHRGA